MFKSWLKIVDRCERCDLDYRFAAPDDGPAFFVLCIALPLVAVVVWLGVAYSLPVWLLAILGILVIVLGTVLPLRPIKGWLVASQFVNRAQEAGTQGLWSQLHGTKRGDFDQ